MPSPEACFALRRPDRARGRSCQAVAVDVEDAEPHFVVLNSYTFLELPACCLNRNQAAYRLSAQWQTYLEATIRQPATTPGGPGAGADRSRATR